MNELFFPSLIENMKLELILPHHFYDKQFFWHIIRGVYRIFMRTKIPNDIVVIHFLQNSLFIQKLDASNESLEVPSPKSNFLNSKTKSL
jgi:hypothetical protein